MRSDESALVRASSLIPVPEVSANIIDQFSQFGLSTGARWAFYDPLLPHLPGKQKETLRREIFYFANTGELTALRYKDWKAIFMEQKELWSLAGLD